MPRLGAALVSGLLLALCLPRPGITVLAWFGFIPLFLALRGRTIRSAFFLGWTAGFGYHALVLYWIYNTCRFALIPVPIAVLAWALLAGFLGLSWGAATAFGQAAERRLPEAARPLAWALCWAAIAVVLERWTPRIAVDLLEYTQYRHLALIQLASVFGPHGLGALIVWVNVSLQRRSAVNAALAIGLTALGWGWGEWTLLKREPVASEPVWILQPNVDQYQKWDERFEDRILENFRGLLAQPAAKKPALVVWPESSLPRWLPENGEIPVASDSARELKTHELVGAITEGRSGKRNAAVLIGPDGRALRSYAKRELVPFGEYVPFGWVKRFVGLLNEMTDLDAGPASQEAFATPLGRAAPSICYEAMFPRLARADARAGASLIVNVTNDGWYRDTWGPYQHFYANVFRAVENRMAVVRAGNTGISAVIDAWGVVTARQELNTRGRLDADAPAADPFPARSPSARTGDLFGTLCLAAGVLLLGLCFIPLPRERA